MWINTFEAIPYGENGVHRMFYEPLPTCAPEEARPYCCMSRTVIFQKLPLTLAEHGWDEWDRVDTVFSLMGQKWTDEPIGFAGVHPYVWHEGEVYELVSGKVVRQNDQWMMEWSARRAQPHDQRLYTPLMQREIAAANRDYFRVCVGRKVAQARANKNLTQHLLAHLSGISTVTISRVESGKIKSGFRLDTLYTLSQVLGIPMSELFEGQYG